MLGLDKRLKEPASLAKKIAKDMAIEGISAEQAAARIRDVVRCTSPFPPDKLVEGTLMVLDKLEKEGNPMVGRKNTHLAPSCPA